LCFGNVYAGGGTRTSDLIYYDILENNTGMCFRLLNATHQIGCSCKHDVTCLDWFKLTWYAEYICVIYEFNYFSLLKLNYFSHFWGDVHVGPFYILMRYLMVCVVPATTLLLSVAYQPYVEFLKGQFLDGSFSCLIPSTIWNLSNVHQLCDPNLQFLPLISVDGLFTSVKCCPGCSQIRWTNIRLRFLVLLLWILAPHLSFCQYTYSQLLPSFGSLMSIEFMLAVIAVW